MANHESETPEIQYGFVDPYQLQYMMHGAEKYKDDVEVTVIPTDTPAEIEAAAREWADHEKNVYYLDREDEYDYLRRVDSHSFDRLMKHAPEMVATHFLVKEVKRNRELSIYELMREYYEPTTPRPAEEEEYRHMIMDLDKTFGEGGDLGHRYRLGYQRLVYQIAHDNPALSKTEVVEYAWSLIPEATAYQQPANPEDLAAQAILIHEGYEAERRIAE